MKQGIGIFFFVISLFLQKQGNGQSRIEIDFNQHWAFNYFTEEKNEKLKGIEEPGYDDSKWPAVAVPHTWSTFETTGEVHPYIKNASPKDDPYWWNGMGWYRKKFIVDPKYKDKKIFIEFEAVQKNCRVYINGKIVGEHNGGFTGFSCDLTDFINFGKENTVVVAVDNAQADDYKIAPMDAGNWDIYGGIYRNVKMLITDRIYIPYQGSALHEGGTFITTPLVSDQKADVDIKTWVRNEYNISKDCKLVTTILDKSGRQVAQLTATKKIQPGIIEQFQQQAGLKDPLLWSPDAPDLYEAISELWMGGNKVDTYRTVFGVREFRWDFVTDELYLNGKKTNLQGFFRHQEYPWVGDAMPDFIHEMDLRDMKENLNCNFVRAGHYPTAPYIYNRCDQMGLITVGDLPNVKDKDFSFLNQQQQAIELVRQQRNHPSI
ncbi:MAG TPA: glycoside hydrolase family 2 TIM barrel-domain containing protein, partial [Chitinophagaceae bacterium]